MGSIPGLFHFFSSVAVSVEPMFRSTEDVYCVHASSTGEIDRVPCGTTVIAYVSKTLQTLEQHHSEYIKVLGFEPQLVHFFQTEKARSQRDFY